jgi:PelA/Pel-15E family pectate lyase
LYMHAFIGAGILFVLTLVTGAFVTAQNRQGDTPGHYRDLSWKHVATQMPDSWYGSEEARLVAENVLLYQRDIGGWPKNQRFHLPLTDAEKENILRDKSAVGATFDNGATLTEMTFLAKVYACVRDERYRKAFEKAFCYILSAQYANGGWPQFFPYRKGKSVAYASHITYNDNAMVRIMKVLRGIASGKDAYAPLQIGSEMRAAAQRSFDKGVECMLKTQIMVDGRPTVWCAQHDEFTLAPAPARSYELPSFSGSESAGITMLLMDLDHPSESIVNAVQGAVRWFERHKLEGLRLANEIDGEGRANVIVVADTNAPPLWARFYDLETGKPFFADRDGIKKVSLAEIGYNRRNGYRWYTTAPGEVLRKYPVWAKKWGIPLQH